MATPIRYRNTGENVIASYDFIDLVTGRGTFVLYGVDYKVGPSVSYALTSDIVYADEAITQTTSSQTKTAVFETKFERQISLNGDLVVNIPMRVQTSGSAELSLAITLSKSDGVTETTIATTSGALTKNWGANEAKVWNLKVPMTSTPIAVGETLRLSVRYASSTGKTIDWFHDPKNRSTINGTSYTIDSSQLSAHIQTKIDL